MLIIALFDCTCPLVHGSKSKRGIVLWDSFHYSNLVTSLMSHAFSGGNLCDQALVLMDAHFLYAFSISLKVLTVLIDFTLYANKSQQKEQWTNIIWQQTF